MQILGIKYPSIYAKLNGMYAKKLKKEQLEELIKQNTIRQAVVLLKSFSDDFKELDYDSRRINIKIVLDDILINDINKISRLLNKKDKKVFLEFISIYEVKYIKNILRRILTDNNIQEEIIEKNNWVNSLFKQLAGLENVKTYDEFFYIIKKTKYNDIFDKYYKIDEISVFDIENSLDRFYFESLMKIAKSYSTFLEDIIGKQIDLNNIIWIYRIKKYYHFTEEEIKNILIPIHHKLKRAELEKLIQINDENEFSNKLNLTYYSKYISFQDLNELEERIERYLYGMYKKYFKTDILDSSSAFAYIGMVEKENNDIMNVMEGIRYQLNKDEIRKKIL